jgi:hypothetical protein
MTHKIFGGDWIDNSKFVGAWENILTFWQVSDQEIF